ncbi:hypothetical protein [Rhizobium lusitanum]|uniref:Uncharacterized protein n=1 Tax=Rhizobium lusitanum TaxID=293958 RepID=A0A1C3WMH9_9HYPH|nr:hypothetical protein [Rhizobium lusitanum]SCB41128.1 hypothetical protein GA0061101_113113 [Rhizobium lusitanum]
MSKLRATEVFTPNDTPVHTYVDRRDLKLEELLRDALDTPKVVASVSGPSKAGKSVLIHKLVDPNLIILVSGATITKADDLWDQAIQWMGGADTESETDVTATTGSISGSMKGGISAILVKGEATGSLTSSLTGSSAVTKTRRVGGLPGVIAEIANSDFILFIDDFHYIPKDVQGELGRQVKFAAERGVKICAASVPHRSDDVVRSNPELSGRIAAVNIGYWDINELQVIGKLGFPKLNIDLANSVIERLAAEAFGSPQLMQSLCLNLCREKAVTEQLDQMARIEVNEADLARTFERTSAMSDYSSVVDGLHSGPKERGQERKQFRFSDGSTGDVYRSVLLAISDAPPQLTFTYDNLLDRVQRITIDEKPVGSSISQALSQMDTPLSKNLSPRVPILEWDENILNILEPYFLFFLRSSTKLSSLGGV